MKEQKRIKKLEGIFREVVFYLLMLLILFSVFFAKNSSGGAPTSIGGFSIMQVLTSSMETEIPKGSLIVTHRVNPDTLEVGDDITYMISSTTTITHRIIEIKEDYADTGERAFVTQGVCNPNPDTEPVAAVNVVGKVIFHSYVLGQVLGFIQAHWLWIAVLSVLCIALVREIKELVRVNQSMKEEATDTEMQEKTENFKKIDSQEKTEKFKEIDSQEKTEKFKEIDNQETSGTQKEKGAHHEEAERQ